jgi:hypothetical protein
MSKIDLSLTINSANRKSDFIEATHTLELNEPGKLRLILRNGTGISLNQLITLTVQELSGVTPLQTWNTGNYFIDSFQEYDDEFVIDATNVNNTLLSQNSVTFTDQNLNSIANSLTGKLSLTGTNFAAGTAFRAGLAVSGIASCIVTDSNEWKAVTKATRMYGYGYFIHNNVGYLVDTAVVSASNITRNNAIRIIDTSYNSIDAVRIITNIKYKTNNTLPNRTVSDLLWGRTVDLTAEGFHETLAAADRRAIGYSFENNRQKLRFRADVIGSAGYLPGQAYGLSSAEFNPLFAKSYCTTKVTNFFNGRDGWRTQLELQQTPAVT